MKIALLTIWHSSNYGAELQTYATVRKLCEMGHIVQVIDYRLHDRKLRTSLKGKVFDFLHEISPVNLKFRFFWSRYIPATRQYLSPEDLRMDPPEADLYLVGSDQVWNPQITGIKASSYFLDFAPEGSKLASYASSFGTEMWRGDARLTELAANQFVRFMSISCRELQGCRILKEQFNLDSTHVLDPTLLHNAYPELTGRIRRVNTLAYYQLSESPLLKKFAEQRAMEMGLEFTDVNHQCKLTSSFSWNRRSIGQWIKSIAESEFVITHSFHGLAMCLLYHRPFVIIYDHGNKSSRLMSLLQLVNLEDRFFTTIKEAQESDVWGRPIDFTRVDEILLREKLKSINYMIKITSE